jgi:predicted DNA-binding protein
MEDEKKRPAQKAFRMNDETRRQLAELAEHLGVNETAVVTLAIRRMAQAEGIGPKKDGES